MKHSSRSEGGRRGGSIEAGLGRINPPGERLAIEKSIKYKRKKAIYRLSELAFKRFYLFFMRVFNAFDV